MLDKKKKMPFPSWKVDPRSKLNDDWMLPQAKAIWDHFDGVNTKSFLKGADKYHINRLYSRDQQPIDDMQTRYQLDEDENSSYMNVDWTPMPVMSKFRRIIEDKIGKRAFHINAEAIDPMAVNEKEKYYRREKVNIELRKDLGQLGIDASVLDSDEVDQPMDDEALTMRMEFDWKHNDAIDIEIRTDAVFSLEKLEEQRRKMRRNLVEDGIVAIRDWTEDSGEVKFNTGDVSAMGVSPTNDPFFKDVWYVFEVIPTLASVVQEKGNLTNDQMEDLVHRHKSKYGNNAKYGAATSHNKGWYDSMKIPVVHMTFKTTDRTIWEKKVDKRGNMLIGKVGIDDDRHEERDYRVDDKKYWYEVKWVMDSDITYEGKACDSQKRKPSKPWDVIPNWTIISPELYDMETVSVMENCQPIVDAIYHANIKLQNVIAMARPNGVLIEIGALEDVSLDGSTTMDPLSLIDMFNQTGNLFYRLEGVDGDPAHWKPIQELKNGLGQEALEHFNVINTYFQYLRDMLGFNDITDGTTPDSRTLNGVASLAEQGTNNAIAFIAEAERMALERLADSVAVRIFDSVNIKGSKFYENILGTAALKDMEEDKFKGGREFSIMIEDEPNPQEVQDLMIDLAKAIDNQQITVADKYRVLGIRNIKQGQQLLAYTIKKREEAAQENAMQLQQKNIEDQQTTVQVAEQAKQQTETVISDLKIKEMNAEYDRKEELLKIEMQLEEKKLFALAGKKSEDGDKDRASKEKISREKPAPQGASKSQR